MDGFAVRAADTPGTLPVVFRDRGGPAGAAARCRPARRWGSRPAASSPRARMPSSPSSTLSIMTTRWRSASRLRPARTCGREAATSRAGDEVVAAGTRARRRAARRARRPPGVAEVVVRERVPRAAVLATGTELRRPGEPLGPGEIYEANGLILEAQLRSAGASVERLAAVADDEDAHREALARGLEHDVLVTSGGVSVGPHDLVRADRGRARRRGGLLARRGEAGQADLVRRARAARSSSGCPETRSRRSSASSSSSGRRVLALQGACRSAAPVRAGEARGRREAEPGPRRARARADAGRRRRRGRARAAERDRSRT